MVFFRPIFRPGKKRSFRQGKVVVLINPSTGEENDYEQNQNYWNYRTVQQQ